jgi:Flp pilus assembly protein CpaB
MRRGRLITFLLLFLIVVVGLVVAFFALRTLLQSPTAQQQAPANVQIYIAGQNIPQGGQITDSVLSTMTIPQNQLTASEFTVDRKAELLNKIAKYPIDQGVPITSAMVTDASQAVSIAGPQWAALIPPGMIAVSIPTTRLSLAAYGINDGAHVNVNACFLFVDVDPTFQSILPNHTATLTGTGFPQNQLPILSLGINSGGAATAQGRVELDPSFQQPFYVVPSEAQRPRPVCQTILQDVVVLKLGNFPLSATPQEAQAQQQQQQPATAVAPDIITLIVSPQDANTLFYLVYTSTPIMMSLRNPNDQSRSATEAATLQFLLSQYNIPVPAKLPYASQPRIDTLTAPTLPNDTVTVKPTSP